MGIEFMTEEIRELKTDLFSLSDDEFFKKLNQRTGNKGYRTVLKSVSEERKEAFRKELENSSKEDLIELKKMSGTFDPLSKGVFDKFYKEIDGDKYLNPLNEAKYVRPIDEEKRNNFKKSLRSRCINDLTDLAPFVRDQVEEYGFVQGHIKGVDMGYGGSEGDFFNREYNFLGKEIIVKNVLAEDERENTELMLGNIYDTFAKGRGYLIETTGDKVIVKKSVLTK